MSVFRMYLVLLVAAIVAGIVLYLLNTSESIASARQVGQVVGTILFLFLAASILPTLWILLLRKKATSKETPFIVGGAVLVLFAYLSYLGQTIDRDLGSTSVVFQPQGCTFSALFPGPPEISEVIAEHGKSLKQANFYGRDSALRAECAPAGIGIQSTDGALLQHLRKYSTVNGLTNPEYRASSSNGLMLASVRGWKKVADRVVTYEIIMTTDGLWVMTVSAGGIATGYPQGGIVEFLSSVRRATI